MQHDLLVRTLDEMIPRGGSATGIHIPFASYLSLICSLSDKCMMVRYRRDEWVRQLVAHRQRFSTMPKPTTPDLPAIRGASGMASMSLYSVILASEFESLVMSIRSALDTLCRVVASTMRGKSAMHSYADLAKWLESHDPSSGLTRIICGALRQWAGELRKRRDQLTHRNAVCLYSRFSTSSRSGRTAKKRIAMVGLIERSGDSDHIWRQVLPIQGGTKCETVRITRGNTTTVHHQLLDHGGRLIIEFDQEIPPKPKMIDGEAYVSAVVSQFEKHVVQVLRLVRTRIIP